MEALVASPLIQLVIDKLASEAWKEVGLLQGVEDDFERLRSILSTIRDVLDDAEKRSSGEKAICNWLRKLKDAAFDADDVVEDFQIEETRRRIESHGKLKRKVSDFFSSHNPIAFRHKMGEKLKKVLNRLDEISEERTKYHLREGSISRRDDLRETCSIIDESDVYGRDEDKENIVDFLLHRDNDKGVSVLAIVGLGGLGKTTLAQLAYNDERIKLSFDQRIWVCISEDFDVKGIVSAIIQCATNKKPDLLKIESLSQILQQTLGGKRFLLVLDDVWNEDNEKWDSLLNLLKCGKLGSKIIVTTRSVGVARVMSSLLPYQLKGLSADHCWSLFRQRAFGQGIAEETPKLVEIGIQIVNKCGGLPLAAKALGGLAGSKGGDEEWKAIRNSEVWRLPENEVKILPALKLSYDFMPAYLKPCFVYCSLFPKDHEFNVEELINLWIAEGFIPSSNMGLDANNLGNQYFNNLLWRSFFQDVKKNEFDDTVQCKMHDLVHDLACFVAGDDFSTMKIYKENKILSRCRHLLLNAGKTSIGSLNLYSKSKELHTLIFLKQFRFSSCNVREVNLNMLARLRYLRVLDLSACKISMVPSALCRLQHLRFLDLSWTGIVVIPDPITSLHNLATLNLSSCHRLIKLPKGFSNLQSLSSLDLSNCNKLQELPDDLTTLGSLRHLNITGIERMPPKMGGLRKLQTLSTFIVGEEVDGCNIRELQHLNQIGRRLKIENLNKVKDPMEAKEANLGQKINLKGLELDWGTGEEIGEEVFDGLELPPNIVELTMSGYSGVKFPQWMPGFMIDQMSSFQNLRLIRLKSLTRCECLPALGHLPSLVDLNIERMEALKRIGEEFYGKDGVFPLLEALTIEDIPNLEEWAVETVDIERERMFPSLRSLRIFECPKLRVQPALPASVVKWSIGTSNEELLSSGNLLGLCRLRELTIVGISKSISSLQHLTALEVLHIWYSLPEGILQQHIPSLRTLKIFEIRGDLMSLGESGGDPHRQQQQQQQQQQKTPPLLFTSLHHLKIFNCEDLVALSDWMGVLTSLRSLYLYKCKNLGILPDGLQRLTALQHLTIWDCPILGKRCNRETGEDWHKISHIPDIAILPRQYDEEDIEVEEEAESSTSRRKGSSTSINFIRRLGLPSCVHS